MIRMRGEQNRGRKERDKGECGGKEEYVGENIDREAGGEAKRI